MATEAETRLKAGSRVQFHLIDVVNREPWALMPLASPELTVQGTIVEFSDSGRNRAVYAVLRVAGSPEYWIVPTAKLQKL